MSTLRIHLLGPPEIRWQDKSLSFPSRKALALLVYLVVEGGMQARETLAALLWPESDSSRATLRNALHQLRSTLPQEHFLHVEREVLGFNFEADYRLDLDVVATAVSQQQPDTLSAAIATYQGDFLEGFTPGGAPEFDTWMRLQQEQWHRRMDVVFNALSRRQLDRGQTVAALDTAESWLAHNPLNEAAYRRLMRLYLVDGNRAAALAVFEQCTHTLQKELGVEPAAETKALAARIDDLRSSIDDSHTTVNRQSSTVNPKFSEGPLVGRVREFGVLAAAYHRSAQEGPQAVRVVGEAGIGKTRLAQEFLRWAWAEGGDTLHGRSFESSRRLPYQPLVAALRPRLERVNAPEDLLGDVWLRELSRLLPELLERYPDLTAVSRPTMDEAAARTHLFEAVTRLLLALAERLPDGAALILFLDDLQWADAATLDVLQYAADRWQAQHAPILLLTTMRAEALSPEVPVAHCWQQMTRLLPTQTVSLAALSQTATADFVQAFGVVENGRFVPWLFRETGGQPFFVVETLKALLEQESLRAVPDEAGQMRLQIAALPDAAQTAVPASQQIYDLINGRLARLTSDAFDLLVAGAVLAQEFSFELLCRVAAVAESDGLRALDELLRSQLLQEQSAETAVPYIFAHDKIRQVVYAEAGAARRRVFHRRALTVLAAADAPAAQLAHHALGAGDHDAAFRHSITAGDQALQLHAVQEAIGHYEQARSVIGDHSSVNGDQSSVNGNRLVVDSERLRQLYVPLGRAYEIAGDYQAALALYDELQEVAQQRGDKPLELAALMARTTVYAAPTQYYDPESVEILTQQALPLARTLEDHAAEAKIQWNLMLLKLFTGDIHNAVAAGEASLAIAREHGLRERMAYAQHDLLRAYLFSGRAEAGLAAGEAAQALWRALDNKAMLVDNLVSTASALYFWQGARKQLIPKLEEALALSKKINNVWNQSYANHILGAVYPDLGYFSRAIAACEQAVALGEQAGFSVPLFVNGSILAWIYGMVGRPSLGDPWVERGIAAETVMQDQQAGPLAMKAFLHLCRGELDAAEAAIRRSYDQLELQSLSAGTFFTFPVDGRLRLARQEFNEALAVSERFIDHLRQTQLQPFRADALYLRGRALLALARTEEAEAALSAARQQAESLNSRRILWEILAVQAQVAQAQGDENTAAARRRQAGEVAAFIADHIDDPDLRDGFWQETAVYGLPPDRLL